MKGIRVGFFQFFSVALVLLCAGLAGCAGNGAHSMQIAPPASAPEVVAPAEIRQLPEAQRREVAAALNTPAFQNALGENAPAAPFGVSHNPRILNTNPFAAAPSTPSAPVARSAKNPASAGYKAFEIPFPESAPLMTIAVWISDDPEQADPTRILLRLQVFISPESLSAMQNEKVQIASPTEQLISVQVSPANPAPAPFDPAKCPPDSAPSEGRSPSDMAWDLADSIAKGDRQKVCDLIRRGAQTAGVQFANGVSALHDAILRGAEGAWLDIAKVLILNGADLNHADAQGRGPLHWAARRNAAELVSLLLENGAELNARASGGHSALDDAAEGGRRAPEAAKILRDSGGICYVNTDSPLCAGAHPPDFLAGPKCPAGTMDAGGRTQTELNKQLRLSAQTGNTERICEWLRRGAEVNDNAKDTDFTALQEATHEGHLEAAKLLLENDAEVNARKEGTGPSSLDLAAYGERAEIAAVLRDAGGLCFLASGPLCRDEPVKPEPEPEPEIPASADKCSSSPLPAEGRSQRRLDRELFLAVSWTTQYNWGEERRTEICNWIRRGADINGNSPLYGLTALHVAALGLAGVYAVELADFLMTNGADANGRDNSLTAPMHIAARGGLADMALALAAGGGDVSATDRHGRTPLHSAALWGKAEVAGILIDLGADVDALAESGRTPLHYAAEQARPETVEALLSHGADFRIEDDYERTALEWAERAYWTGERNVYVLEVFTHLRLRVERLQEVMAILRAAEAKAESSSVASRSAVSDGSALAGRFASSFSASPAFGDMFGAADKGSSFVSRLDSLMHSRGAGEKKNADGLWFSAGVRGDAGFGVGGSEWGGVSGSGSPYALLAGSGLQAGGEIGGVGGNGRIRFAAFGDFERGGFAESYGGWAARGIGVGEDALAGLSAVADGRLRSGGALAEFHGFGGLGEFALQGGAISESGAFLSGVSRGEDLRGLRSRTAFAGISGMTELGGGWRFRGSAHLGRSWAFSDGILLRGDAWSSSFAAGLERGDWLYSGDAFILRVSQPLRVERWEMELAEAGSVFGATGSGPSGRQLDADAAYRLPLSGGGWASFSAGVRSGGGHAADSGVEGAALFSVERAF